ncbi:cytosolic endo-beta-N-acetylglucosaminidase isoform X1 [Sitophilus oryzae]|uniref:Cytosolic endo-beta-N-acetylglucosaminidase isoform X1 n=1 Tax=Sitophilus oryzae TaxID=7048 RepID=A0A6J2XK54_SITOR|nr:cytosolic endo-beta-N-acetylglucosaminidase isoform X1 [Sitophilus oryzae]
MSFQNKRPLYLNQTSDVSSFSNPKTTEQNFITCDPIKKYSDIEDCLSNLPQWVEKVVPLKKRCQYVVKNSLSDCHSIESDHYIHNRLDSRTVPKTLICHDYKGGYLTDSYVPVKDGDEKHIDKEGYTFYNWSQIDYFVYFSHHFITIPPLSWINAAHKNGVKILGTLITEFTDGAKICDEGIFNNRDSMKEFAFHLTEIVKLFGFDGWLLNIENEVKHPDLLKGFVEVLTQNIHKDNSENIVIWYDSVTKDGKLLWQDQLNCENKCFFDLCDGIFLNYCWNEEKLANTVKCAGSRRFDVFVGVDVFGRNMFGGGQFNTFKAVELVSKYNLSMAIFAPGWTYETMDKNPENTRFSRFLTRDDTFWFSLLPYLYTRPINDFFFTNFHLGLGQNSYSLFIQEQQTSRLLHPDRLNTIPQYETVLSLQNSCDCLKREYVGAKNVCLISKQGLRENSRSIVHNIFLCDIKLQGKIGVSVQTENLNFMETFLDWVLLTVLPSGSLRKIKLLGERKSNVLDNVSILEVNPMEELEIKQNSTWHSIYLQKSNTKFLRFYEFTTSISTLLEIGPAFTMVIPYFC